MAGFAADRGDGIDLLVATTVIEVGIDVPAATVMVIEHAERFGLAQLHQLRGRIGRGDQPSTCLLLYQPPLGEIARRRLAILRETEDGFRIAEEDLRLRGGGEVLGTRQSGLPQLRLADLARHEGLIAIAHDDARLSWSATPTLSSPRGEALRCSSTCSAATRRCSTCGRGNASRCPCPARFSSPANAGMMSRAKRRRLSREPWPLSST